MPYIGTQPKDVRSFGKVQFDFTATQGQTAFTGADDDGKTLGFTEGQIQVYVNGILMDASDYTTSNTNTVTLVSAANLNDIITVVALQTDIPNSDYVPISGGTFSGDMNFSGDLTVGATAIHVDGTNNQLGIGASSIPSGYQLNVHATNANSYVKLSNSTLGNTANDGLDIISGTDGIGYLWNRENAEIRFGTNNSERMRIDNVGRVTIPNQPAFCLQGSGVQNFSGSSAGWVFKRASGGVHINRGNHLVPSTGVFTAPVAGAYKFTWQMAQGNSASGPGASLDVNGSSVGEIAIGYYTAYGSFGGSIIRELSANDTVRITVTNYNSSTFSLRLARCYFSGFLIG